MIKLARAGLAAGLAASTVFAGVSAAAPKVAAGPLFADPVRLTPIDGIGGFEPSLVLDKFDNVWVTAHRPYHPIAPDAGSPARQRLASWLWTSKEGKTFTNPPSRTPVNEYEQYGGGEGDVAVDAAGGIYFVDLVSFGHSSFSAWKTDAPGKFTQTQSTPLLPAAFAQDRPFIAAGGDGTLFITENNLRAQVDRDATPGQPLTDGQAAFYVSLDGGKTLTSPLPYAAEDTGFCRPLVDRKDSRRFFAACFASDPAVLVAYSSRDAGETWTRQRITTRGDVYQSNAFPSVAQTPDGTLHALFQTDPAEAPSAQRGETRLHLFSSRDGGKDWSMRDVTPARGTWQHTGLAAAPNGNLGLAGFYRADSKRPWQYRAAVFGPRDRRITSAEVAPGEAVLSADVVEPQGEFSQPGFDSKSRLHVTYPAETIRGTAALDAKFNNTYKVMYARQRR